MLAIIYILFLVFHAYGRLSGSSLNFFCIYSLQLLCLKLKKLRVYAAFIHLFILLVCCLYLSDKISNSYCAVIFLQKRGCVSEIDFSYKK